MLASPSKIVRAVLVSKGLVTEPAQENQIPIEQLPGDGSTLCYVSSLPDEIDQAVLIKGTAGLLFARGMRAGDYFQHPGIKILVRALDHDTGYDLISRLCTQGIDTVNRNTVITLDGTTHYVQSIYRTSTIIELGEEQDKKRQLFTINARVAFQAQEPSLG